MHCPYCRKPVETLTTTFQSTDRLVCEQVLIAGEFTESSSEHFPGETWLLEEVRCGKCQALLPDYYYTDPQAEPEEAVAA